MKTFGGKFYLARRIISLMPPHRVYVEPYLGGGSVLLNKVPSAVEVVGDLDPDLISFWLTLRDDWLLEVRLNSTPYDRDFFQKALEHRSSSDVLVRAWAFVVRNRMSRGGLGQTFAWSERLRGGQPGDVNAWQTFLREVTAIRTRVYAVSFHCCEAISLIAAHDCPDGLIYCDPPYLPETRTAKSVYDYEMTRSQHEELLSTILCCRATVMISGYRSDLYDRALSSWTRHEFDLPNHSGQGKTKQRRIECLWVNRPRVDILP